MKRTVLWLVLCLFCISLSACGTELASSAPVTNLPDVNFNNNYWSSGDFWAFDNTLFYLQDGFYNMGAYRSTNGNNDKLFEESDFGDDSSKNVTIRNIFACDSCLYFDLHSDQENRLYRYDLKEGTYAPVCEIPSLYRWVVVDNYFIYREHPANNDEHRSPLCVYDLKDGTTTQVCANVEEFGIIDGQLRYITYGDVYELFQYNYAENDSTTLDTFRCEFDDKYDIFNFTPGSVIMLKWGKDYNQNLVVYSLSSNSTAIYTLPKEIHRMVAYDQYAYAVIYNTRQDSSEAVAAKENGIYRIHLSDGSYEVIERNANSDTEIHVTSDDCVYILQRKMNILYQSKRHIYKFDYMSGQKEKLTVI